MRARSLLTLLPRATDATGAAPPLPARQGGLGGEGGKWRACAKRRAGGGARSAWRRGEGRCDLQGVTSPRRKVYAVTCRGCSLVPSADPATDSVRTVP